MMRKLRVLAFVGIIGTMACATSGAGPGAAEPFSASRQTTVRIIVQNRNFQDARLYTYRRGTRRMLGTVTGKSDREFVIDWDLPDPMYMEIDMLAGPKCFTEELQVDPGDVMELQIDSHFANTRGCSSR